MFHLFKIFDFSYQKSLKFREVTILTSLNYRYIIIICVLFTISINFQLTKTSPLSFPNIAIFDNNAEDCIDKKI